MSTKLTAENVEKTFLYCLFAEGENTAEAKLAEGVITKVGFHPGRLSSKKEEIAKMLNELPDTFRKDKGGGWSFLNACMTKENNQWGEHRNIDQLLCLGLATEQAKFLFPRNMWTTLPGGVPYFSITSE